jgi:PIN domain nuclease of toxin-antitoxin system
MKLLLDTHVLLWAMLEPAKLSPSLRDHLEDSRHQLWVSKDVPINSEVARQAGLCAVDIIAPPFDRLLAAQAMAENLILANNDGAFDQFEGLKRLS